METQINNPNPTPKKSRKWFWIISLSVLGCLCLIVAIPLVAVINNPNLLNLFKTGEPRTNLDAGTYEGTVYTAPGGLFSCDFKDMMTPGLSPLLQAFEDKERGTGVVFASDDFGQQFGVDYFNSAIFGGSELADALALPDTRAETLQAILENVLLPARGQNADVADMKFVQPDILFAAIIAPGASHLTVSQNGGEARPADNVEAYLIFTRGEWFYFVYHFQTLMLDNTVFDLDNLQSRVEEFHRGCTFQP